MTDLKKEIKKLQRFREDTMKWFANPEVKDKSSLIEARRKIEVEMERFKAFERESKTKPFSMMGLAMGDRLDAHEQKKQDKRGPLEEILEALGTQCDSFRVEWEILTAKKKKSKDEASRIDELKKYIDWHAFHIGSLEQVLRRLDNDLINPDDMDSLIETLNVYLEQYEDPDYFHDEDLYEQYNLGSDAVDATYYKPNLSEEGTASPEGDAARSGNQAIQPGNNEATKVPREAPLTAVAKARAKKLAAREMEAAANGGTVRPDYPPTAPPKPQRPPMPHVAPPALPAVGHHPSRPAPTEPCLLPDTHTTSVWNERKPEPVIPDRPKSPLLNLLEASWSSRPKPEDLIRVPRYIPSNVYVHTGSDGSRVYPEKRSQQSLEFYSTLPLDTLILMFYYREGTAEQFGAAQELKRRNWRFHKKFGMWFQRSAEGSVKTLNPTFEFGSYSFFDVSTDSWGPSTRTDMTFEYEFLDEDQLDEQYPTNELVIRRPPVVAQ